MNEVLIENWNKTVKPQDVIFVLGDFAFCNYTKAKEIFDRLQGKKFLIRGNHDSGAIVKLEWEWVAREELFEDFILSHYPHEAYMSHVFDGRYAERHVKSGNKVLHGHKHSYESLKVIGGTFNYDVGVDGNKLAPVSYEYIKQLAKDNGF